MVTPVVKSITVQTAIKTWRENCSQAAGACTARLHEKDEYVNAPNEMLKMRVDPFGGLSSVEVVACASLERLEETIAVLKAHRSAADLRQAMVERIARSPMEEFETLKHLYLRHCGDSQCAATADPYAPAARRVAPFEAAPSLYE